MIDIIICSGLSDYAVQNNYAIESPFLLFKDSIFCDAIGLYRLFVEKQIEFAPTDIDAPPYVCYVLKQVLHNKNISSEMVFYLDQERDRMEMIFSIPHRFVFLTTTLIPTKRKLFDAVREIRKVAPLSTIICGGAFVDLSFRIKKKYAYEPELYAPCFNDYLFLDPTNDEQIGIDLFIINDPELNIAEKVIQSLKNGVSIDELSSVLPNIAFCKNNKWHISDCENVAAASIPVIDWAIFREDEIRLSIPMSTSKGCPNHCGFCNFQSLTKHQEKKHDVIATEFETLKRSHGAKVRHISFCDDNICGSRATIKELLDFFINFPIPFSWSSLFDARFIDEALADKLALSKCVFLKIGFESVSDIILRNIRKPCRALQYKQAIKSLVRVGISVDAYFIAGYPGETQETINQSIAEINSFEIPGISENQFMFFPFILAPLSPIYDNKERMKYNLKGYLFNWVHDTMTSVEGRNAIPAIVGEIHTMNPHHGNIEKIIVHNKTLLAQIDRTRGELIRDRLKSGKENNLYWKTLEQLIKQLKAEKDPYGRIVGLY